MHTARMMSRGSKGSQTAASFDAFGKTGSAWGRGGGGGGTQARWPVRLRPRCRLHAGWRGAR
eukprot:5127323-Prymnesium_polylepis.1